MTQLSEIKKDKRFPPFITSHSIFNTIHEIKKIFPLIGLSNFSEPSTIDNSTDIIKEANVLMAAISREIRTRASTLTRYAELKNKGTIGNGKEFGNTRKVKYKRCSVVLKKMGTLLNKPASFLVKDPKSGKITLNIPSVINSEENIPLFKKGEGLFKVYNKINELLRDGLFAGLSPLDELAEFKKYNNINVPGNKVNIVFSSTGMDGAWDLATMSERGIGSCQSWNQNNKTHLVGSIIDPFTAIMYLTLGSSNEKGLKMTRRCIVRYVLGSTGRPSLIVERMYPTHNKEIANTFISLLKEKTKGQLPIQDCSYDYRAGVSGKYIPITPVISKLQETHRPYRDSGLIFSKVLTNKVSKDQLSCYYNPIIDSTVAKINSSIKNIRLKNITPEDRSVWRTMSLPGDFYISFFSAESSFLLSSLCSKLIKDADLNDSFDGCINTINKKISSEITNIADECLSYVLAKSKLKISNKYKEEIKNKISSTISKNVLTIKKSSKQSKIKHIDSDIEKLIDQVS